jgi:hypothetical protein
VTEREAAPRLEGRTADFELAAPYTGWTFTARLDFPARWLEELASSNVLRVCAALDRFLIVDHNFPDIDGNVAASMLDVYPAEAVVYAVAAYQRGTSTLPNP